MKIINSVRIFGSIIFLMAGIFYSQAQQISVGQADILLISGNRITGELLMNTGDSSLIINPSNGMRISVPLNIIKNIKFSGNDHAKNPSTHEIKFFNFTSLGLGFGKSLESVNSAGTITAEMVNGIKIRRYLNLGLGIGFDQYDQSSVVPYFISLSGDLADSWITPFYFIEAGTSSAWGYDYPSSYYYPYLNASYSNYSDVVGKGIFNAGIGYRIYINKGMNLGFSVSYKIQNVSYYNNYTDSSLRSDITYRRIILKLGFGF